MRAGHLWLATFAVLPLVGAPVLAHAAYRGYGLAARGALAAGLGAVLLAWTMTLWAVLGVRWSAATVLVALLFAAALRPALRGSASEARAREPDTRPKIGWAATVVVAVSVLAALAATVSARSTSPDLLLFWGPKAQQFAAARTIDAAFLGAPFLEYLHVYYPPLVTNLTAFASMIAGRFPWGAATLTFPLLLAATAVALPGLLVGSSSRARSLAALAVSALALVGIHASVAGNAEPFLWFFEATALALLLSGGPLAAPRLLLAGLLLAGAAASKVEGLPFVAATVGAAVLLDPQRFRPLGRSLLLLLAPAAIFLATWFAFGASRKLFIGYSGYGRVLDVRWDNLPEIFEGIGAALWRAGYGLPWLVPLGVFLATRGKGRAGLVAAGLSALFVGFLLYTYLTTAGDPAKLIEWSSARVLSPLTAVLALGAAGSRPRQ